MRSDVSFTLLCLVLRHVWWLRSGIEGNRRMLAWVRTPRAVRLRSAPIASPASSTATARAARDRGFYLAPCSLHQRWCSSASARRRSPLKAGSRSVLVVLVVRRFCCLYWFVTFCGRGNVAKCEVRVITKRWRGDCSGGLGWRIPVLLKADISNDELREIHNSECNLISH